MTLKHVSVLLMMIPATVVPPTFGASANERAASEIVGALKAPPRACTQIPFWFWNGPLEPDQFRQQLREMADKGVYAAMPHPRFGMDRRQYLEEPYWQAMTAAIDEARKLGVEIWLYDEYNWPSGGAAGRVTDGHPEWYPRGLDYHVYEFDDGPRQIKVEKPAATDHRMEQSEKIVRGFIRPHGSATASYRSWGTVSDDGATLSGSLLAGPCDVLVFFQCLGRNPSILDPGSGSFIDYLAREPTQRFLSLTHEQYFKRFGDDFGDTVPAIFSDEASTMAPAPFPWTPRFVAEFKARRGMDILDKLPCLLDTDGDEAAKVRLAYWQTVTDLYADGSVGAIASWCGTHDLGFTGHVYEENIESYAHAAQLMTILRLLDKPGFDALGPRCRPSMAKAAISVAHLQDKDALCECLGLAGGWNCTLDMLRTGYNVLGALGTRRFVPHAFFQTLDNPRVECPPSFFQENPYWKYYRKVADLSARLTCFNSYGTHVAPCAVYYPVESLWADSVGGKGQNVLPWQHRTVGNADASRTCRVFNELVDRLFEHRWDLDVVDDGFLADSSVKTEGEITSLCVGPEQFRVLIVPPVTAIGLESLKAIDRFLRAGGRVVWLERLPRLTWPLSESEPQETLRNWFGTSGLAPGQTVAVGQGRLSLLEGTAEVVCKHLDDHLGVEVPVSPGLDSLRVTHRRTAAADVFLLFNDSDDFAAGRAKLGSGIDPVLVDLDTGRAYRGAVDASGLVVSLRPHQSMCAAFGADQSDLPAWMCARPEGRKVDISADWEIQLVGPDLDDVWQCSLADTKVQLPVFRAKTRAPYESVEGWMEREYGDRHWKPIHALRGNGLFTDDASVLLRATLPPGTKAIEMPLPVSGEYALWFNANLVEKNLGSPSTAAGRLELPVSSNSDSNVLAIETYAHDTAAGLEQPLTVVCGPARIERLKSWTELGFGFYSGRVLYRKTLGLDPAGGKVWLDLGTVQHYAEVYVNGKLVDTLLWPPYELDVTAYVKQGGNQIALVVSNSIANRFAWDVWGTRGTAQSEPSGILGPASLSIQQ